MTIANPYKLDTVVLTSPSATFAEVRENDIQPQVENVVDGPAGHPAPMFAAINRVKPMTSFKTTQLDVLASNIPVWGVAPGATLYQKRSSGVAPLSRTATSHRKLVMTTCIAYWSTIDLPSRDIATADITLCSIYDGTDEPIIATASVALAGTLPNNMQYFCAGPVWWTNDAGTPVTLNETSIDSIRIESGCQFRSDGDASSVFDTYGEVTIKETIVTIKTKSPHNVSDIPLEGVNLTAFRFFARQFKLGGTFIADGTAAHIKYSATVGVTGANGIGLLIPVNVMASGQELYADTFKISCLSPDGITPPIVMTPAQAIA